MNITSEPATITHIVLIPTDAGNLPSIGQIQVGRVGECTWRDHCQNQERQRERR